MTEAEATTKMLKYYYDLQKTYVSKYGKRVVVLIQVGAFYEIYGMIDRVSQKCINSPILDISKLCNLVLSIKNKNSKSKYYNAGIGFRDYSFEKYLEILLSDNWIVPVYNQDSSTKNTTRSLLRVFTPGSTILENDVQITNNVMCIWLEKKNHTIHNPNVKLLCGISTLDNHSGKPYLHEYIINNFIHNPSSYEELERFYSVYSPNEVYFIYKGLEDTQVESIIQWCGLKCNVHTVNFENNMFLTERAKKCENQLYQKEIFEKFYSQYVDYNEFCESNLINYYEYAKQSFSFLLDTLSGFNKDIIEKIREPKIYNQSNHLILGNHSLKQLNIISDKKESDKLSSVVHFISSHARTVMGKRELNRLILNPIYNDNLLNSSYDNMGYVLKHYKDFDDVNNYLEKIVDIEKIYRRIFVSNFKPHFLLSLFNSIKQVIKIYDALTTHDTFIKEINKNHGNILHSANVLKDKIETTLKVDECTGDTLQKNIFHKNIYDRVDKLSDSLEEAEIKLETIRSYLDSIVCKIEKKKNKNPFVNFHVTEKNGIYIQCTKRRCKLLQEHFKKSKNETIKLEYILHNKTKIINFETDKLQYVTATSSNNKIENPLIKSISNNITNFKNTLMEEVKFYFNLFIKSLKENDEDFRTIINFIISLDTTITKAFISKKYNYVRPIIEEHNKSFVDAKNMRHFLIEQFDNQELYVANDISLGKELNGICLFGTNAVGKSSFIKSLGICIVLAQSGMYVPCSSFVYKPYKSIFTRILGNDNIFKGLSTFQVEMVEFNSILKHSDQDSLILGDELCSGTETISAISIFASGLLELNKKNNCFIFATHFHEITKMKEITNIEKMALKHMKVIYNAEQDCLIYERKIQDGPGNSNYGLEVCRSLQMPKHFLEKAYAIRGQLDPTSKSITTRKKSSYNSKKIKSVCEMCDAEGVDIHHLQPQSDANKDGIIETFHKNHVANLMNVCKTCHNKFTKNKTKLKRKKTTKGFVLQELEQ